MISISQVGAGYGSSTIGAININGETIKFKKNKRVKVEDGISLKNFLKEAKGYEKILSISDGKLSFTKVKGVEKKEYKIYVETTSSLSLECAIQKAEKEASLKEAENLTIAIVKKLSLLDLEKNQYNQLEAYGIQYESKYNYPRESQL